MPPSTDDLLGRTPPVEKPERGKTGVKRKQGKQRGAPGAHLAWTENPNETLPHYPRGACGCGADLATATDLGVALSHQEHDIPQVTVRVFQHDRHRVRCGCGAEYVAPRPEGLADAPVSYGVNLQSLCVFLMVVHAIPVQRCAQLIEALTGAAVSPGFVHGMLKRTFTALSEVDQRIRTLVTLAYAVCLDETPLRVGTKRMRKQLLVACTQMYTCYMLGDRSLDTFKAFLLPELTGIVVYDRYTVYDNTELNKLRVERGLDDLIHQLCTAHLLRDLADVAEAHPDEHWPIQIADALRDLIHAGNTARDAGLDTIDEHIKTKWVNRFRNGVLVGLKDIPVSPAAGSSNTSSGPCSKCSATAKPTYCVSPTTSAYHQPPTTPNAIYAPPKPNRKFPADYSPKPSPPTATASPAPPPPPPNTESRSCKPSATHSSATPGCPPSPPPHNSTTIKHPLLTRFPRET